MILSYCWEDARTTRGININGNGNNATANLEAALRQLRESYCTKQSFKLCADAICIDQSNLEEFGQLVGWKRDIYASAWHVVISLGVDANDSLLAMTAINHLNARIAMGSRAVDA